MDTQILTVPRDAIDPRLLRDRARLPVAGWEAAVSLLGLERACWIPRSRAESDPRWKQVIPYVTLAAPDGRVLVYPRQGREKRLHERWSVGIGGHVEREDAIPGKGWEDIVAASAAREVREEYPAPWAGDLSPLAVINEDETEVGHVHVGVHCRVPVVPGEYSGDGELNGHLWLDPRELARMSRLMEIWSELALEGLR